MFRPDNPKILMKDPTTARARVYVGSLSDSVKSMDIESRFSKYGKIMGVLLHRGFGFIQYETEENASDAINNEHQNTFHGRILVVRRAQNHVPNPQNNLRLSNESPVNRLGNEAGRGRGRGADRGLYRGMPRIERNVHGGNADRAMNQDRDRSPLRRSNRGPFDRDSANVSNSSTSKETEDTNDCEIIVMAKSLTKYAEDIEQKLKQMGMIVDLLFPNEDVEIGRVISNIIDRKCLYAVLVGNIHEENKSMTLFILHGVHQAHKDMAVADALALIKHDFETYCSGGKQTVPPESPQKFPHIPFAKKPLSESIKTLADIFAENRTLTVLQFDKLIRYLQDRREEQVKIELGDMEVPIDVPKTKTEHELQERILNILNKPAETAVKNATPDVTPQTSNSSSTHLLHDPNVQKALDSLMQGNLLQNIAGVNRLS